MKKLLLVLILSGCVSAGVTPIGSNVLAPLPADSRVFIYTSEKEVTEPYKIIGLLSYSNPGKYQILSLSDAIPDLMKKARSAGGNGIIIDENHVIKSGIISTGIGVTGRIVSIKHD